MSDLQTEEEGGKTNTKVSLWQQPCTKRIYRYFSFNIYSPNMFMYQERIKCKHLLTNKNLKYNYMQFHRHYLNGWPFDLDEKGGWEVSKINTAFLGKIENINAGQPPFHIKWLSHYVFVGVVFDRHVFFLCLIYCFFLYELISVQSWY